MKIKKGDILYQYNAVDISDKDYCTDEYSENFDAGCKNSENIICPIYNKCNCRPKKSELTKVRITKLKKGHDGNVYMYRYVRIKYDDYKPRGTIFVSSVNSWAKSESAALKKHHIDLKKFIKKVKRAKPDDLWFFKKDKIKAYESLLKRLTKKFG